MDGMKTVTLDAHTERSQMAVISADGEILIELQVETSPEELRRVVSGVPGPKRVILESGPLSAMIHDALDGVAEQVVSCDPTRKSMPNAHVRWQMRSLYRQLDGFRRERVGAHRIVSKHARKIPILKRLRGVPGLGPKTAPAVVAWIADPNRFRKESGLSSYAGLGLKNDISNWKTTKRARASKRPQVRTAMKERTNRAATASSRGRCSSRPGERSGERTP